MAHGACPSIEGAQPQQHQRDNAAFAGVITDKLGRRLATAIFDVLAWVIPCIIWASAQSYWYFFINRLFIIFN